MRKLLTVLAGATLVIGLSGPAVSASSSDTQSSDQITAMGKGKHGSRGNDLVVPAGRSHVDGATNTIVGTSGTTAHDRLPGSPEAQRELALW